MPQIIILARIPKAPLASPAPTVVIAIMTCAGLPITAPAILLAQVWDTMIAALVAEAADARKRTTAGLDAILSILLGSM